MDKNENNSIKYESDPKKLVDAVEEYLNILERLSKKKMFGEIVLYPANGVDSLVTLYAKKVIGLNFAPYKPNEMINHILPILTPKLTHKLKTTVKNNLINLYRIDASETTLLKKVLKPYSNITPKSLILKGMFEYVFLREWDIDVERFYDVSPNEAATNAKRWIEDMTNWLNIGDTILAFDPRFFTFLVEQKRLKEIDIGKLNFEDCIAYRVNVPIIFLSSFVRVFKKV
ncbi:MAG: hypothetical protein K8R67_05750 [Desulfobacteraceae bacterium]|nr:hypothetical protein [Desulfobacteraceae bacterium]